ncbi:hypothetical protein ACFL3S_11425 [Gemmatimonadota bacterium]
MSEPDHLPRRYGEAEIARILRRATELQHEEPVRARGSEGLSLAELEEIAVEVGIDPLVLRRAAVELDSVVGEPTGWARLVGDRVTLLQETVVPGELPDSGFERIVPVIQDMAQDFGQPSLLGHTLTWSSETASKTRSLQVMVSALFAVAFPLGVLGITYLGARAIYRAVAQKRRRVLADLLQRVAAAVTEAIAEVSLPEPEGPSRLPST